MNQAPRTILFLITKATGGGAQKYVFDLATHLPTGQFQVAVAYGESGRLKERLEEKKIPLHPLPALARDISITADIRSFFQIWALLRRVRPQALHVNSSKAAALGALAARFSGVKKIVFTAHGWPFKEDRTAFARLAIYLISWFTALLSTATVVVSKRDETIGKKMWFVGKKIHFVPLGIEPPQFLSREQASSELEVTTSAPRIVSIGELTKNKGIGYAIEAIAQVPNVEYFIIGDGELRAALERRAQELHVADRVHFLGFVENAAQYLKAFNLFLLPSIKEGAPYVLLEARAANLLIVATNAIDDSSIPCADADALARALRERITVHIAPATLTGMVETTSALYLPVGQAGYTAPINSVSSRA